MTTTAEASPLPVWINDNEIDPKWLQEKVPNYLSNCIRCVASDVSNQARRGDLVRNGATLRLHLTVQEEDSTKDMSLIVKQVASSGLALSAQLGLAREAFFFKELVPKLLANASIEFNQKNETDNDDDEANAIVPKIYYSWGNMESGEKFVIMEDLSNGYVDSGILFGPGNPNNWTRDLPAMIGKTWNDTTTPAPSSYEVAHVTFQAIAKVHATFWCDQDLLQYKDCLRCCSWLQGQNKESWEGSQQLVQHFWATTEQKEEATKTPRIQWDPLVRETVEKAVKGISWEAQLERLNTKKHWTLVHGDFWPGNVMIAKDKTSLRLLDWEMTGLGSGPQDLGQYILSNMDPSERRECEEKLIRDYFDELVRLGVSDLTWEECWREYRVGGLERWLWFLVYFCGQEGPLLEWAQFFHNQIASFMKDHQLGPDDIVQPRP